MAKQYVRKPAPSSPIIGIRKSELISVGYSQLNARLHRENPMYGSGGSKHAETVQKIVTAIHATSVLDYGCGKGSLARALPFPIWEYDPSIPEKSRSPRPADLVVCTDVLEHIEPDKLMPVLADLKRCVLQVGYFVIHTGPAQKVLADGRNTHLIQQNADWWVAHLKRFFVIGQVSTMGPLVQVLVGPLNGVAPQRSITSVIVSNPTPLVEMPVCL